MKVLLVYSALTVFLFSAFGFVVDKYSVETKNIVIKKKACIMVTVPETNKTIMTGGLDRWQQSKKQKLKQSVKRNQPEL